MRLLLRRALTFAWLLLAATASGCKGSALVPRAGVLPDASVPEPPGPGTGGLPADYAPPNGPHAPGTQVVAVSTEQGLRPAIAAAVPGDEITLENGTYDISADLWLDRPGTPDQPIFVRARNRHQGRIRFCNNEGFRLWNAAHWVFEGLVIEGVCFDDGDAVNEHAFHIMYRSSWVVLRDNHVINFKSDVKLNGGETTPGVYEWPDDVWFIGNTWQETLPLGGLVPHNVLNLDGGDRHVVRGNAFVDIGTSIPEQRSASAIYLKLSARDFLVEQNLVLCRKHISFAADRRGIFGGDGYGPSPYCEGDCANERGLYRNNIVLGCQGQGNSNAIIVGYEKDTTYLHNTVFDAKNNFMHDYPGMTVKLHANLFYAPFLYQGATRPVDDRENLFLGDAGSRAVWTDPGIADFSLLDGSAIRGQATRRSEAPHDFCGHARGEVTDPGAIDYAHPEAEACVRSLREWYSRL